MSAKPDAWMPLYFGAYLTDTMHLTTEQHGAYFLLLMACWKRGGSLPDDDAQLAAIARLTAAQWRKARAVIAPFWQIGRGVWTQKRLTAELEKARGYVAAQSENGKKGGRPKKAEENPPLSTGESQDESKHKAESKPDETPSPLPSQESLPSPSPSHSPPPAAAGARGLMSKALRDRGITNVTPSTPELDAWVTAGISIETVLEAVTLARDKKPAPQPIPFGYIVPIVEQLAAPPQARVNGHHGGRPWFIDSWPAIVRKGAEKGLTEDAFESPPEFKKAVLQAHGITSDQVRKAEADWRVSA